MSEGVEHLLLQIARLRRAKAKLEKVRAMLEKETSR